MSAFPASYWVILSAYLIVAGVALHFFVQRRDCFSCSISSAIRRSVLFGLVVTPTVIPSWQLSPVPASLLLLMLVWAVCFDPDFPGGVFVQVFTLFVLLPTFIVSSLSFLAWLWRRRRRQLPTLHPDANLCL
jgi:hypothetical protein